MSQLKGDNFTRHVVECNLEVLFYKTMYQFIFSPYKLVFLAGTVHFLFTKIVKSESETDCTFNFHFEHHGGRRDVCGVYEVSVASCVTLCQSRNGIQLQRDEEIHNMASTMDISGKIRKGVHYDKLFSFFALLSVEMSRLILNATVQRLHEVQVHVKVTISTLSI